MKNPLRKRTFRELKEDFSKYLVIFLFMTLTIGFISGFLVAAGSMKTAYDESFEKLVYLFETYFKLGGTHFQLTYVSKEDLVNAKKTPDKYKNLRVRVSGFSDYFVFLNEGLQDEIIQRTTHTK